MKHQPLLTRFDRRLQCTILAKSELPLDDVDQVVQLQEIDVIDAQPIERAMELFLRTLVVACVGLVATKKVPGCRLSQGAIRNSSHRRKRRCRCGSRRARGAARASAPRPRAERG